MDDVAVGRGFRALRLRRGWSQRELARRAGLDASVVGDIEAGWIERVRLPTIRTVARALEISVEIAPRWPIADVARLLDADHAVLVERVVRMLRSAAWEIVTEYTFNDYGDRGSVDVLGWHSARRALLIVEVKSRVADVQETHAAFDRKARVVPRLVVRERGWRPLVVGNVLVIAGSHRNRELVRQHAATFAARFPHRSRAVRGWIREPSAGLSGLWFVPIQGASHQGSPKSGLTTRTGPV